MTAGARTTDPDTSHLAAEAGDEQKWSLHRELLLAAWYRAGADGLTDEEAGDAAHLVGHYFWKRAGELRMPSRGPMDWEMRAGAPLVAYDGRARKGRSGRARKVSVITEHGREYVLFHGLATEDPEELRAEITRLTEIIDRAIAVAQTGRRGEVLAVLAEADRGQGDGRGDTTAGA